MTAIYAPTANASASQRGSVSVGPGLQEFAGPKRFVDAIEVADTFTADDIVAGWLELQNGYPPAPYTDGGTTYLTAGVPMAMGGAPNAAGGPYWGLKAALVADMVWGTVLSRHLGLGRFAGGGVDDLAHPLANMDGLLVRADNIATSASLVADEIALGRTSGVPAMTFDGDHWDMAAHLSFSDFGLVAGPRGQMYLGENLYDSGSGGWQGAGPLTWAAADAFLGSYLASWGVDDGFFTSRARVHSSGAYETRVESLAADYGYIYSSDGNGIFCEVTFTAPAGRIEAPVSDNVSEITVIAPGLRAESVPVITPVGVLTGTGKGFTALPYVADVGAGYFRVRFRIADPSPSPIGWAKGGSEFIAWSFQR